MLLNDPQSPKLHANLTITIVVLLGAYSSLVGALLSVGMGWSGNNIEDALVGGFSTAIALVIVQLAFLFLVGTRELVQPVQPARQILPLMVFAAMTFVLLFGFGLAILEFLEPYVGNPNGSSGAIALGLAVGLMSVWCVWLVLVILVSSQSPLVHFFRRMALNLLAGSLFELLLTVPAHLVVIRRPGCFVGLGTMLGIFAGVLVLVFSGGPAIVWVMMHFALSEKEKAELRRRKRKEAQFARDAENASDPAPPTTQPVDDSAPT